VIKPNHAFAAPTLPFDQQSRRRVPRVPVNISVTIEHQGTSFDAVAANVGLGGAFIECGAGLSYGEQIVVHLPLPGMTDVLRLLGIVRWSNASGFGVQFSEMGARETHAISALMAGPPAGGS
jgi:hypothetical protein